VAHARSPRGSPEPRALHKAANGELTITCGNRHCPQCHLLATARWLAARRADLLPIPYFHVVFTLPHALNPLAQGNPRVMYSLLFRATADTLLTFGRDSRHLGGTLGIIAILHTWGQALTQNPHS
jgi:Transposase zinc-binding domain